MVSKTHFFPTGTGVGLDGPLNDRRLIFAIGESSATLVSYGMWYHALTRIGADGTEEDGLFHMMDTPTGIATIFSEVVEIKQRRTTINWAPDAPRTYLTAVGSSLPLVMTNNNGLGWLRLRPITDQRRLDHY